eukprot:1972497-Prymnesium_polylepis.2
MARQPPLRPAVVRLAGAGRASCPLAAAGGARVVSWPGARRRGYTDSELHTSLTASDDCCAESRKAGKAGGTAACRLKMATCELGATTDPVEGHIVAVARREPACPLAELGASPLEAVVGVAQLVALERRRRRAVQERRIEAAAPAE